MTSSAPAPRRARSRAGSRRVAGTAPRPHRVAVGEREVALRRARPIREQLHRVRRAAPRRSSASSAGTPSDGTATIRSPPSASPSRLVASTDTCGAALRDRVDLAGDRVEEMLTVVEHQQQPLRRQILEHRLLERSGPANGCTRRLAASVSHTAAGSVTGANSHNHAPSRKLGDDLRRDLQREAGLADPADPGQGHQRRPTHQVGERRDLGLATDERRHLTRQVARERVQRSQRRELPPQVGMRPPGTPAPAVARSRSRCSPRSTSPYFSGVTSRAARPSRSTRRSGRRAPPSSAARRGSPRSP